MPTDNHLIKSIKRNYTVIEFRHARVAYNDAHAASAPESVRVRTYLHLTTAPLFSNVTRWLGAGGARHSNPDHQRGAGHSPDNVSRDQGVIKQTTAHRR
ncbi:hypothetical protein EVAR_7997_1 [Eumeta japonica]|uniref:Uncharacterized protein n=1 Tax=Eumeta variegata TaxID=151549 RepID=A0A4C1TK67_EUMVA|nr:hypothetical protein EVAR_7997_1 [Eumeta japonica]